MKKTKDIMQKIFSFLFYLIPIDKKMIVLESNPSYNDNTGVLFDKMLEEGLDKKYKIVWLIYDGLHRKDIANWREVNIKYERTNNKFLKYLSLIKANYFYARAKYNVHSHRNKSG